jgi:SAM-dependent methyltransferase
MFNWIHSCLNRLENGYDPVPSIHAHNYGAHEWNHFDEALLNDLEGWVGGFYGKKVLDLGGGPGHYTVAFAKRGAHVTWLDVSRNYYDIAQQKVKEYFVGDNVNFVLGYMDDAPDLLSERYDFVFNRVCFYYGRGDASFSDVIYRMVREGGFAYIDTTHEKYKYETLSAIARLRAWLNSALSIKIGHPFPPHGRLASLFLRYPVKKMLIDYSSPFNDRIRFQKF